MSQIALIVEHQSTAGASAGSTVLRGERQYGQRAIKEVVPLLPAQAIAELGDWCRAWNLPEVADALKADLLAHGAELAKRETETLERLAALHSRRQQIGAAS